MLQSQLVFAHICHLCCRNIHNLSKYQICSRKYCSNIFCNNCIQSLTLQTFDSLVNSSTDWDCFSCTNICKCSNCNYQKNILKNTSDIEYPPQRQKEEKNLSQDLIKQPKINIKQQLLLNLPDDRQNLTSYKEGSSEQFIALNYGINHKKKYSKQKLQQNTEFLDISKQQSHSPYENSSEINYSQQKQKKSQKINKTKKQRSLIGLKSQGGRIPPYLQSIMKRKTIFRNFMLKHSQKSMQQLLKQEMTSYKSADDILLYQKQSIKEISEKKPNIDNYFGYESFPSPVMKSTFSQNYVEQSLYSPINIPQTPSFLPVGESFTAVSCNLKLFEICNQQLKQYEMGDDDLSLESL